MIKRFLKLIRSQFLRKPSANLSGRSPQTTPRQAQSPSLRPTEPRQPAKQAAGSVTYVVPRAEIVSALNHTLQKTGSAAFTAESASAHSNPSEFNRQSEYADHSGSMSAIADAAYLCECQRRYGEAERLYKQVLTLRQQRFDDKNLCVADSLSDLAALYRFQKRYSEALPLLQQALKIRQQLLTSHHLETGKNLYHLADTYRHQRLYGKAEPLFQQALIILRQQLGSAHSLTQSVYSDLMQMLVAAIESGQFNDLITELPPLDLSNLSETYSWAKPHWARKNLD